MRGKHEFMYALTSSPDIGIEFVEDWRLLRLIIMVALPIVASFVVTVVWSCVKDDAPGGFTIGGKFMFLIASY